MTTTSAEIISIEKYQLKDLFDPDNKQLVEGFIDYVETQALSEVCDASTEEGRKRIWNIKNQVVAVEKAVDNFGKKIQADAKAVVDQTNVIRKGYRDHLASIKEAVMKPRVEWEEKEAARQAKHREMIAYFKELGSIFIDVNSSLENRLAVSEQNLNLLNKSYGTCMNKFEEFEEEAEKEYLNGVGSLEAQIGTLKEEIKRANRLADLEAAEEKRKAEAERQRLIDEGKRLALEEANAKAVADVAAKQTEEATVEAIKEDPTPVSTSPQTPPVSNVDAGMDHRRKVNSDALEALCKIGVTEAEGKAIVTAIICGEIPHISITY